MRGQASSACCDKKPKDFLDLEVRPWVKAFLAQRGLRLSPAKTRATHIGDGFDFLGWNFRRAVGIRSQGSERQRAAMGAAVSDTEIVRHQKVKGDYNPFDPRWEAYGENLRAKRLLKSMAYRKQWASLFLSQHGNCALCGDVLTDDTGWHDHHLIPRVAGGSDALSNRVLLHPVCHVQVHVNGLTVAKPAST